MNRSARDIKQDMLRGNPRLLEGLRIYPEHTALQLEVFFFFFYQKAVFSGLVIHLECFRRLPEISPVDCRAGAGAR